MTIAFAAGLGDAGKPDFCAVSSDLGTARMLEAASEVADRDDCDDAEIQANREKAARYYGGADAFAASAKAARASSTAARADAKAAGTDAAAVTTATARADAADKRAARAEYSELGSLVDAATLDPFQPGRLAMLNDLLARMPELASERAAAACLRASALASEGLPGQASQLRGLVLHADRCREAEAAIEGANGAGLRASRAAATERANGKIDDARHQDALALRANAALTASRDALAAAAEDDDGWVDDTVQGIAAFPGWLGDSWQALAAAALALLVLATLAFRGLQSWSRRDSKVRAWIDGSRLGRRIARLYYKMGEFEGGKEGELDGKDVATQVGAALTPTGPAPFPFDRLPAAPVADQTMQNLASFLKVVPHGDVAAALLNLGPSLFPRRTALVEGRLLPTDGQSAGLFVSVDSPEGARFQVVLRAEQIDPQPSGDDPAQQARLIGPASVWVRARLRGLAGEKQRSDSAVKAEMLATGGDQWAAAQDLDRAATCYARALDLDPALLTAQSNLGVAEIREGAYAAAVERFERLYREVG